MRSLLALPLLLIACGDGETSKDGTISTPTESHVDSSTLVNENCQDVNGTDVPGAAVYFSGTMVRNGGTISGIENVFFVANDTWKDSGEDDCSIAISVSGSTGEPLGCSVCDLSVEISATMIDSASDCPEALMQDYESYIVTYDVQTLDDGTANWFFHESGNQFASGTHTDTELQYLSDAQCQWY
jgi:hypothetical protein